MISVQNDDLGNYNVQVKDNEKEQKRALSKLNAYTDRYYERVTKLINKAMLVEIILEYE